MKKKKKDYLKHMKNRIVRLLRMIFFDEFENGLFNVVYDLNNNLDEILHNYLVFFLIHTSSLPSDLIRRDNR